MSAPKPQPSVAAKTRSRRSIAHMPASHMRSRVDQDNMTADLAGLQQERAASQIGARDKKSRSKSLGPGGLDALQDATGNRRKSVAAPLKSILKPTVPVSPIRAIPSFQETRQRASSRSPVRSRKSIGQRNEGLLIDFSSPAQGPSTHESTNPFDGFNASSALAEQRVAEKEREENEKRERERKVILDKREARRKSMANRRVSFAPEATLHTWNVVELMDDSTASSAATNAAREAMNTPGKRSANDVEEPEEAFSSSPYSGSSAAGSEDTAVQSENGGVDDDGTDLDDDMDGESTAMSLDDAGGQTAQSDDSSTASSDRIDEALRQAGTRGIDYDEDGEQSMELATQEITGAFRPWIKKGSRRDEEELDLDDLTSRHDQENMNPGYPSLNQYKRGSQYQAEEDFENDEDEELSMDITNVVGGILGHKFSGQSPEKKSRISLPANNRRTSAASRKSLGEASTLGDETMEFTNVVGNGIDKHQSPPKSAQEESDVDDNEEMTMEFTSVFGGVVDSQNNEAPKPESYRDYYLDSDQPDGYQDENAGSDAEEDMEMTRAVGGILATIPEQTEPQDDGTMGMDITAAMGQILPPPLHHGNKFQGRTLMEMENDAEQLASSPFQENVRSSPMKSPSPFKSTTPRSVAHVASESGSPILASVRSARSRRSEESRQSPTPIPRSRGTTPVKKPTTPSHQVTPQPARPTTPSKTPPSSNVAFRSSSPKRLFKAEIRAANSARKSPKSPGNLFYHDEKTGQSTPSFVLRPRRLSGLGIDKEGLGSPRVAEMLDRRPSIGEKSPGFTPQENLSRGVRFDDPRVIEEEIEYEREDEIRRSSGMGINEHERDATTNLRDMISSLSPKKNKLKGRKSLHVGAAKGLLGKRPVELDLDEEEDEDSTPKRLKGRDASPVKKIKLPAPPSEAETTGRSSRSTPRRSPRRSLAANLSVPNRSPLRPSPAKGGSTTPGASKSPLSEAVSEMSEPAGAMDSNEEEQVETGDPEIEPIQLQDFLNMTNIHFMELTTTKRRHTMAPDPEQQRLSVSGANGSTRDASLEDCVAAGFCTVPMLELYQHSCRELKSYIAEGRRIIRSIEAETYADNPPLFREYVTARADIRILMDNQFRNVKTHARLLSKSMWYEWRMKLLEGLKEGLDRHIEEMRGDDSALSKQEKLLGNVVPGLVKTHTALGTEAKNLQEAVEEIENCDQEELRSARERLAAIDAEIDEKKTLLSEMQIDLGDKEETIEAATELKDELSQQIRESERVIEECRGWSIAEVKALKASVHALERRTGWSIVSATHELKSPCGPVLEMCYHGDLIVKFYPGAFRVPHPSKNFAGKNMPLELNYLPVPSGGDSSPSSEKDLILQYLRAHLEGISQASVEPKQMLGFVAKAWDLAGALEEEVRKLRFLGVTKLKKISHALPQKDSLRVRCVLLGVNPLTKKAPQQKANKTQARVDVDITINGVINGTGSGGPIDVGSVKLDLDTVVSQVYGFTSGNHLTEKQMKEVIRGVKGKGDGELGSGVWSTAVKELEARVFPS